MYTDADDDADFLSDILIELGAYSVSVSDRFQGTAQEEVIVADTSGDQVLQTTRKKNGSLWKQTQLKAWFPINIDAETMVMNLATNFHLPKTPSFAIETTSYADGDDAGWVSEMKKHLKAVDIGDTRIHFPWQLPVAGKLNLKLNPGCSFGTGDHATTQLCMRWLQDNLVHGGRVLDYGTGSGALAIRAGLHDASISAVGVDIDATAVEEARSNAERNGVSETVSFCMNKDLPDGRYDIVVANILASVLKELAGELVGRLVPGGKIGLSGILCEQAVEVGEVYKKLGIHLTEGEVQAGWTILSGEKPV